MSKKGIGVLEAVIAMALLGAVTWGLTNFMGSAFKGQGRLNSSIEFASLAQSILTGLRIREACQSAFRNPSETPVLFDPSGTPNSKIDIIRFNGGAPGGGVKMIDMSQPVLAKGVTLTKVEFNQASLINTVGSTTDRYLANLHIEGNHAGPGSQPPLRFDAFTQLLVDRTSKAVQGCEPNLPEPPPTDTVTFDIGSPGTSAWTCKNDLDLENICSDVNGCTVRFKLFHETYYDFPYQTDYQLLIEQPDRPADPFDWSTNTFDGLTGSTLAGYNSTTSRWYTGRTVRNTVVAPWSIIYMLNYNHGYCTIPHGAAGPALPAYHFSFLLHPSIRGHVSIKKNYH